MTDTASGSVTTGDPSAEFAEPEDTPALRAARLVHSIRGDVEKLMAIRCHPGVKEALADDCADLATAEYWLHDTWEWLRGRKEAGL